MINEIKGNLDTQIKLTQELYQYSDSMPSREDDKMLIENAKKSLKASMKIINNAFPVLVNKIPISEKLSPSKTSNTGIENIEIKRNNATMNVSLQRGDRENFLQELRINESLIKRLKRKSFIKEEKQEEFKAARGYLKLSNKFFLNFANRLIEKGYFKSLSVEIKKANVEVLFATYIAMICFTTFLSLFVGIAIAIVSLFFNISLSPPFIVQFSGDILVRALKVSFLIIFIPIATFLALYIYPSTERKSLSRRIDQELPFAVIHMSSISGSGIEPSEIFKIIGLSREYPALRVEIRKVLNQINIYGYDLTTSLNNVASATPSQKLADLLNGIATTINSGGDLSTFFEKRAETLLLNYRLERERYTKVAETFMDIYISVVIAAPMILMLLLVMIRVVPGIVIPFSIAELTLIIVSIVAFINILFLGFLQLKQPGY